MNVYEAVTAQLIELIESGDELLYENGLNVSSMPTNFATRKRYNGINFVLLHLFKSFNGFSSNYFMTANQAEKLGGSIKNWTPFPVVYYNITYKDKNGKKLTPKQVKAMTREELSKCDSFSYIRYSKVFNLDDIDGIDIQQLGTGVSEEDNVLSCDMVVNGYHDSPKIVNKEDDRQYYSPLLDFVNMPKKSLYKDIQGYYAVLFHELVHSTGHKNRLNRSTLLTNVGHEVYVEEIYSQEELVAELGASMLCSMTGISSDKLKMSSASYLKGYLSDLKDDPKFIFKAAKDAEKAVKHILGE